MELNVLYHQLKNQFPVEVIRSNKLLFNLCKGYILYIITILKLLGIFRRV